MRQVLNGILYLVRTGCQWRLLPKDFPPWNTVHTWYRRWRRDGTWEDIHPSDLAAIRPGNVRAAVVQAAPVLFDTPKSLQKLADLAADAVRQRAELVVFPEAFVGGYPTGGGFQPAFVDLGEFPYSPSQPFR